MVTPQLVPWIWYCRACHKAGLHWQQQQVWIPTVHIQAAIMWTGWLCGLVLVESMCRWKIVSLRSLNRSSHHLACFFQCGKRACITQQWGTQLELDQAKWRRDFPPNSDCWSHHDGWHGTSEGVTVHQIFRPTVIMWLDTLFPHQWAKNSKIHG